MSFGLLKKWTEAEESELINKFYSDSEIKIDGRSSKACEIRLGKLLTSDYKMMIGDVGTKRREVSDRCINIFNSTKRNEPTKNTEKSNDLSMEYLISNSKKLDKIIKYFNIE